ncbi:SAC3/GANP/Nin1/mts3/eIF-3 p25 family-domain-containing protein [Bombardia bombarda]|uniref:SAC3/GANP/Nin1/mts3/eIF-3 p25 family-domain-containing protein n=1 Tax=Bombardia bombarda TaxID=252184 RepID=A0AA40CFK5_9PEZI|nr:SAC3/GANP/Nin1/mts3/eIF-3 p25 family-domain-containing protein [Bombardia bombarda]
MAQPANNPFGAPSSQVKANPFGGSGSVFGASPFQTSTTTTTPFGKPTSVFGAPAQVPATTPFGQQGSVFGAPSQAPPTTTPFGKPLAGFGAPPVQPPSTAGSVFGVPPLNRFGTQSLTPQVPPSLPQQNPFNKPIRGQSRSPSPAPAPGLNPFNKLIKNVSRSPSPAPGPNSFGKQKRRDQSPFQNQSGQALSRQKLQQALGKPDTMANPSPFGRASPAPTNGFGNRGPMQPVKQANIRPGTKTSNVQQPEQSQNRVRETEKKGPTREPTLRTKQLSLFAYEFANKLYGHLRKERIMPPKWVQQPGNPSNRGAVDALKEAYKKYRGRVYDSLRKAEYIDDPEKRRRLEDALPFKGICEDMCPEFEQISRIAEFDIKTEEKQMQSDGLTMWPEPCRMVKKFGRSAAGQDAPLPMDVRSVDALRRTTDYLFNDLLQSESNLPAMHNYLWDRTRAVRKDFTFHSQKSPEEMKDMVMIFETITRFHATALHLLSRKGYANDDFDQRQEIEQLGRTILSLIEAYDECRDKQVPCPNEPEFRAYYLLLNAHDPSIAKRIPAWGKEYWFNSKEVQTALSLIQVMEDVREPKGPIKPRRPTSVSDTAFTNYFSIVEDSQVSYAMACIAEVHFTTVRQCILKNLVRGYARHRDAPRTITASDLNKLLRFDTEEEAVEFAELHNFEFSTWVPDGKDPVSEPYLLLNNKTKFVPSPRVRQAHSGTLVERKRTTQSLLDVIYNTIYEIPSDTESIAKYNAESEAQGLFVNQVPPSEYSDIEDAPLEDSPTESLTKNEAIPPIASVTATSSPFGAFGTNTANATPTVAPAQSALPPPEAPLFLLPTSQPAAGSGISSPFSIFKKPDAAVSATTSAVTTEAGPSNAVSVFDQVNKPSETAAKQPDASPALSKPSQPASPWSFLTDKAKLPSTNPAPVAAPTFGLGSASRTASTPSTSVQTGTKALELSGLLSFSGLSQPSTSLQKSPTNAASSPVPASTQNAAQITAPSIPAILVTEPSITSPSPKNEKPKSSTTTTVPAASLFQTFPPVSSALQSFTPSLPPPPTPANGDLMGDFTKWFVKGDDGLMEQFMQVTVVDLLSNAFNQWQQEEAARQRREEDEASWQAARKHQIYNLRVKYFYKWQEKVRKLATKRILREGKEKMKRYREQQRIMKKKKEEEAELAELEAMRAVKRQIEADGRQLSQMAMAERRATAEEQLLASGIFSGLRNERAAARQAVMEVEGEVWGGSGYGEISRPFGYAESELELEPMRASVAQRERERVQTPDSAASVSKRDGWKTRSLREKFGLEPRGSVGSTGSGSVNGSSDFRQSFPSAAKTTNFSRKRPSVDESSEDGGRDPKRQSLGNTNGLKSHPLSKTNGFKTRHWELRSRGLVPMPDGNWLPEAMAYSLKGRKQRFGSSVSSDYPGDGVQAVAKHASVYHDDLLESDADEEDDVEAPSEWRMRLARLEKPEPYQPPQQKPQQTQVRRSSNAGYNGFGSPHSGSESIYSSPSPAPARPTGRNGSGKRKRNSADNGDPDSSSPSTKKSNVHRGDTLAMVASTQRMLRELRETMDRLDEDRPFMREQIGLLRGEVA